MKINKEGNLMQFNIYIAVHYLVAIGAASAVVIILVARYFFLRKRIP